MFRKTSVYRPPQQYNPPKHTYTLGMFPGFRLLKPELMRPDMLAKIYPGIRASVVYSAVPIANIVHFDEDGNNDHDTIESTTVDSLTQTTLVKTHFKDNIVLAGADITRLRDGQISHVLATRNFSVSFLGMHKAGSLKQYIPVAVKIVGDVLDDPIFPKSKRTCILL